MYAHNNRIGIQITFFKIIWHFRKSKMMPECVCSIFGAVIVIHSIFICVMRRRVNTERA